MTAAAQKKALERGKAAIDDAINVFRVVIARSRFIPEHQRLQTRGLHYYVRPVSTPRSGQAGAQLGFRAIELGVSGDLLEFINEWSQKYYIAFNVSTPAKLREPIARTLTWIGSSAARENYDDRIVDLCTALESLLSMKHDPRKAEAIALRYMLLGFAVGEVGYVTHPFAIYKIYLMRNDIVHGTDRLVCDNEDYKSLLYVALDAVDRMLKFVTAYPSCNTLSKIFDRIRSLEALQEITSFIETFPAPQESAALLIGELVKLWHSELTLKEFARKHNWTISEKWSIREQLITCVPSGTSLEEAAAAGFVVTASGTDPVSARLAALESMTKLLNPPQ